MDIKVLYSLLQDKLTKEELEETMEIIKNNPVALVEEHENVLLKEETDKTNPLFNIAYKIYGHIKECVDDARNMREGYESIESPNELMDSKGIAEEFNVLTPNQINQIIVKLSEIDVYGYYAQLMFDVFVSLEFDFEYPELQGIYELIKNSPKDTFKDFDKEIMLEEF